MTGPGAAVILVALLFVPPSFSQISLASRQNGRVSLNWLDELRQILQSILLTGITDLRGDDVRLAFLHVDRRPSGRQSCRTKRT